jgi:hypothetical protein
MAQTKIKPVSSGSFTNYTGKATVGLPVPTGLAHQAQLAVNEFAITQGAASTLTTRATKRATAAGISLQWA